MKITFDVDENNNIVHSKNRGMSLEAEITESNIFYRENNIALIYKKPTPIRIVKCSNSKITEAYFDEKSTTDFNGVYKGRYIDIEAKETNNETSFPLNNIEDNQIEHIENVIKNNGLAFLFVEFTSLERYFMLEGHKLIKFIKENNRKSIPLSFFIESSDEVERSLIPPLDYIKIIDKYIKNS